MSMRNFSLFFFTIVTVAALAGCTAISSSDGSEFLAPHKGEVLVALLGTQGCPGTEDGTKFLAEYNKTRPEGVSIMRVDVPAPGGKVKRVTTWTAGFEYAVDEDRDLAERLDFFYYPTLYILDRDGEMRYSGACDDGVKDVVKALLAEKPGDPKPMFSPTMLEVGEKAESFSLKSLQGNTVSFDDIRGKEATLLIFNSTTCPFSKKAVISAPELASKFSPKGASIAVMDRGSPETDLKSFYMEKIPDIPVLLDPDCTVSQDTFGVTAVPFFYIFDKNGAVAYRMPFSEEAAEGAMKAALGMTSGRYKGKSKGAG